MRWVRKSLILIHRYLGTALGLLFFVWFVSGIGMMYAGGMPRLTAELRLLKLPPIDLSRIRLTPVEAVVRINPPTQQASQQQPIGDSQASTGGEARGGGRGARGGPRITVGAILDRPVYRVGGGRGDGTIVSFTTTQAFLISMGIENCFLWFCPLTTKLT